MSPICLTILTIVIYILLAVCLVVANLKKKNLTKLISLLSIGIGALSLLVSLVCYYIYQNSDYLAVLFALFFVYIFFTNLFKQDSNYEDFGKMFFIHLGWLTLELIILIALTFIFEKKIDFIKNVIIGELIFPTGMSIILYTIYLFIGLMKKYDEKFLYCKMLTLLTFYINIIAILFLAQVKIDNLNTILSSILVALSLLMNFIDKAEDFNYYFRTDGKIKNENNDKSSK